jgi:hypothetical protein
MSVTCNGCGTVVEGDDTPLGWVGSVECGVTRH